MMTKEEYLRRLEEEGTEFNPGWDAVTEACRKVYGDRIEQHMASVGKRAIWGGDQYLDGVSIHLSAGGYRHLVTYGMSSLYGDPDCYGKRYSGWGYEMTFKLMAKDAPDCIWAANMLSNLARYTYTKKAWFEPFQYVSGGGNPIKEGSDTLLKGLVCVSDTELEGMDTPHGRLDFIQLVGITQRELDWVMEMPQRTRLLVERMQADNPRLVTDLARTKEYAG